MIEMLLETSAPSACVCSSLERTRIRAISEGELDRLESYCRPDVVSHLLTPWRHMNFDNVTDLVAKYRQWFGECSEFQVEHSRVEQVGERLGISYRFRLQEQGAWYVVEQQLFCTMQGGWVTHLHLLCSGFQPVDLGGQAAPTNSEEEGEASNDRDASSFHTDEATGGSTCALLTPAIKSKLR